MHRTPWALAEAPDQSDCCARANRLRRAAHLARFAGGRSG